MKRKVSFFWITFAALLAACTSTNSVAKGSSGDGEYNISVNGINLHYAKTGSGRPLILLHGNGEDHHIFDVITQKLKDNYTVYAVDSRNHGQSELTDQFSYDFMAEDLYQFILALNLDKPDILGFSDGAINSLIFALNHGDRANKIILLGVNLKPQDAKDEILDYIRALYEETPDPLLYLMLTAPNIELADISTVANPILVVGGEDDVIKGETFVNIASTLPNARLLIMEGHDHTSYIVEQDLFYPYVVEFLSEE
jgi:pimeloyl-ACP methyl ester carboxylesterase